MIDTVFDIGDTVYLRGHGSGSVIGEVIDITPFDDSDILYSLMLYEKEANGLKSKVMFAAFQSNIVKHGYKIL